MSDRAASAVPRKWSEDAVQVTANDACVTWSVHADRDTIARAHEVAAAAGLEARARDRATTRAVVVVEKHGAHAVLDGHRYDSHPGMGLVRVRRYRRGDRFDQLLKATGVREGDQVTVDVDANGQFFVAADATGPAPTYEVPEE